MKYAFIRANAGSHAVRTLCRVLKVSKSGYYEWRRPKDTAEKYIEVVNQIKEIHSQSRGAYGARRIKHKLAFLGYSVTRKTVVKLMKIAGVWVRRGRKLRKNVYRRHKLPAAPNLLSRNFTTNSVNRCWVTDITQIRTDEGWLYLATFLDLYSRKIVGWSMSGFADSSLVTDAFRMACGLRGRAPDIVHSDRGVQYACEEFVAELAKHPGCSQSMSRRANCLDNAVAESFFATLKCELVYKHKFKTLDEASISVFEYIEVFYNQQRLHSYLEYVSPKDFETYTTAA